MTGRERAQTQAAAYEAAAHTPDPELPALTIEDLGILRQVRYCPGSVPGRDAVSGREVPRNAGEVVVTITPTYSGCPAMCEISADVKARLARAGFTRVTVRTQLSPPWSSDWITAAGHRKLAAAGIAPPSPAGRRTSPVPLNLGRPSSPRCPRCACPDTSLTAQFSATACKSLHRCHACGEPFEAVKSL